MALRYFLIRFSRCFSAKYFLTQFESFLDTKTPPAWFILHQEALFFTVRFLGYSPLPYRWFNMR